MKKADAKISTIIGSDVVINGDFQSEGSVRLDGDVEGDVKVTGTLVIGATGKINGAVEAAVTIIGGEVIGDVTAPDKIELTSTARVIGNIKTDTVVIDEKAIFHGFCNMNQDAEQAKAKARRHSGRELKASRKSARDTLQEALMSADAGSKEPADDSNNTF